MNYINKIKRFNLLKWKTLCSKTFFFFYHEHYQ